MTPQIINIGICDDEVSDRIRIKQAVENEAASLITDVRPYIQLFPNASLLKANQVSPFHLVFLDVLMPEENGFELARYLRAGNALPQIVFVSNHDNLIFDSQEYTPLWFVRKNLLEKDIHRALAKYLELVSVKKINYKIKEGFGYREILLADIVFIECSGHELSIRMKDGGRYYVYGSLKSVENELSPCGFARVHRNYLVNLSYVSDIAQKEVILLDRTEIPMGKDRKRKIMEAMAVYRKKVYGIP